MPAESLGSFLSIGHTVSGSFEIFLYGHSVNFLHYMPVRSNTLMSAVQISLQIMKCYISHLQRRLSTSEGRLKYFRDKYCDLKVAYEDAQTYLNAQEDCENFMVHVLNAKCNHYPEFSGWKCKCEVCTDHRQTWHTAKIEKARSRNKIKEASGAVNLLIQDLVSDLYHS